MLASPAFIVALCALLLNDFLLKGLWHDWFTGKLSDFAGLFVLASLLLITLPRRPWMTLLAAGLSFAWWKSPLSQASIDFCNAFLTLKLHRVVDYSDLLALMVLPLAALNYRKQAGQRPSRFIVYPVGLAAMLAVMATSSIPVLVGGTVHVQDAQADEQVRAQLYQAVDSFAATQGLTLDPEKSDETHRRYTAPNCVLEINYDPASGTLFYGFLPIQPGLFFVYFAHRAPEPKIHDLESAFVQAISAKFPDVHIEQDQDYAQGQPWPEKINVARFSIRLDPTPCARDLCGLWESNDPYARQVMQLVEDFAAEQHLSPSPQSWRDETCDGELSRVYQGGNVIGPELDSHSLRFETYLGFNDRNTLLFEIRTPASAKPGAEELITELRDRFAAEEWAHSGIEIDAVDVW